MSFIITSNVNLKDKPLMSDVHKPYSYSNHLTDTMKILKNSEIAVQSVKINKNGLYSVNKDNSKFGLYFGEKLEHGVLERDNQPNQAIIGEIVDTTSFEELTTDDVADKTTEAFSRTICHPHYITEVGNNFDNPETSIVVSKELQGNEFDGYNMVFTQNYQTANINLAFENEAVGFLPPDYEGNTLWTYDVVGQRFTSNNPDDQANTGGAGVFLSDYPLALNANTAANMALSVNFTGANNQSGWCVGLDRHNDPQINPVNNQFVSYSPPYWDNFYTGGLHNGVQDARWTRPHSHYEYVITRIGNFLRIYHSVVASNRAPRNRGSPHNVVMKELRYWEVAGSHLAGAGPYNLNNNADAYERVGWTIDNEAVEPWIYSPMTGWAKIIDLTLVATDKLHSTKPRGTLNNMLFAKLFVRNENSYLDVLERRKVDAMTDWTIGNPRADYVRHLIDNNTYHIWGREIENRPVMDYDVVSFHQKHDYVRADPMTGVLTGMNPVLIMAPSNLYIREMTKGCNTQFLLGFNGMSLSDNPVNSGMNGEVYTFTSPQRPELTSSKSLFVKLSNFTHQTANAKRGQKSSKILAHLPRFDSAGNEVGGLYFEPHERVYVSLGNPNDMYLNDFDVEIVYDNEELAECLSGKTIVCFHIRQKNLLNDIVIKEKTNVIKN